ncbi:MAG: TonB-dependent receptor [Bacteroidales bacterium]|nr:TonB-dependent receptor [Bacteroidales bacterium]MBN2820728.1 TonB-dependent receptor [Bacteroidales bacterium]
MRFVNFLLLFLIFPVVVQAQAPIPTTEKFSIKGKVSESETGQIMEYVNVVVYSARDSSMVTGTISQSDGSFEIIMKSPGKYYITVDFIGYEKQIIDNVLLRPGSETYDAGEIKLNPARVGIKEVEVVAEKPFISYQLDKKVVDVSGNPAAQGGTAVEALENVPSIQTDMEGNVTLRGSSNFTVLIDGRPSLITGTDALNQVPASAIDKIEIITNPSVKYDPDGTTGIINIISKKGKLKGHSLVTNLSAGTSPMYSAAVNYSYRKNKMTVTGGINYRNYQGEMHRTSDQLMNEDVQTGTGLDTLIRRLNNATGNMKHGGSSFKLGFDYELFKGNVLTVGTSYNTFAFGRGSNSEISSYYDNSQINNISFSSSDHTHNGLQFNIGDRHVFNDNQKHYLTIDATYQPSSGTSNDVIETGRTILDWEFDPADTNYSNEKSDVTESLSEFRLEVDYQRPITDKIIFETGYTLRNDNDNQKYNQFSHFTNSDDWMQDYADESSFSRTINAGWALVKGEVKSFNLSAGLRVEHTDRQLNTVKDDYDFNYNKWGYYPSFAISKNLGKENTLQATYSKRINRPRDWHLNPFPRLSDGYTQFLPNPELEPEYASAYEMNYQKSWGPSFVSVETFYNNTENKMERIKQFRGDTIVHTMTNLGSDKRYGGELGGQIKVNKWLSFNPTITAYYYVLDGKYQYLNLDSVANFNALTGENEFKTEYNYEYKDTLVKSSTFDARLFTNIMLSSKSRIQLMAYYRGAENEIDDQDEAMYWLSTAVRQDFMDRKLTVTLRVDDMFGTRKQKETSITSDYTVYSERYRKSPQFVLSVNFKLNQNNDRKRNGQSDHGGMDEGGGGEEMDMGF